MGFLVQLSGTIPVLAITSMLLIFHAHGQIDNTTCTALPPPSTFFPCINSLINTTGNASSSPVECCSLLRNLISNGVECFCHILSRNIPFPIPIYRALTIPLPAVCNMTNVPLQCNASGTPLPASGPASLGPAPTPSSQAPVLTPPLPTSTAESRSVLTPPSASVPFYSFSPSLLLFPLVFLVINYY